MSASPRFARLSSVEPCVSTVDSDAVMLASALRKRGRVGMSVQREFADGEVVPGTRYRVVGLIGSGGMGSVYEVEHEELGKRFVLKALLRSLTNRDDLVHRLRNEWRALGRLEHPNIVSVTDAGLTSTGVPFYVMERLQGETLSARLRRERRLPLGDALDAMTEVLEGLSAAHRIGIVHRDVKPPNVFLVGGRFAKLLDFGIAKMLDPKASQITGRGVAIGTPRYMAPEQATGGTVDARTDLYATGLILFEMIAGAGPFDAARDANELFLAHLAKEVPVLSAVAPGVPPELDQWMARLLAKKPEDRPADAAVVATALRALRRRASVAPASLAPFPPDDRTSPGGPFDTLEAAHTVPSDRPAASRSRRPLNDATTRTGIGPQEGAARDHQSGRTLRLDTLEAAGVLEVPESPTRTAAPVFVPAPLQTPPPVEPGSVAVKAQSPGGRPWMVGVAFLGAAGIAAATVTRQLERRAQMSTGVSVEATPALVATAAPLVVAPAPLVATTAPTIVTAAPIALPTAVAAQPVGAETVHVVPWRPLAAKEVGARAKEGRAKFPLENGQIVARPASSAPPSAARPATVARPSPAARGAVPAVLPGSGL